MAAPLGQNLEALLGAGQREIVLVAPYVKVGALERLLDVCDAAARVRVVTRWRIEEIAAGVSDLEVWPLLRSRSAELWLHPDLHAKYYRADERQVVGSANLTAKALGWSPASNLEILVEVGVDDPGVSEFEKALWAGATRVDNALYDAFHTALGPFAEPPVAFGLAEPGLASTFAEWRPQLRFVDDLYRYYSGDMDALTVASRAAAEIDLGALDPPGGLSAAQLRAWIALRLRFHPEMIAIHELSATSRRFGEMRGLLRARGAADPSRDWQTWMRWISHLYPDDYVFREANYSEIFSRAART